MNIIHDFACPNCRRVRRRKSKADSLPFKCACVGKALVECPRVKWELADWKMLDQPLADTLGVGSHVVSAKRKSLHKARGTIGRKIHARIKRRIDPSLINPGLSCKENALLLHCTPERIRQLLKELNQTTP